MHYTYILRCADDTLYTGYALDVNRRVAVHNRGKASKYTRARLPVALVYVQAFETKREALQRERQIKKLDRMDKIKLIRANGGAHD